MAGNARFHDKLHRKNHHTNQTVGFPDSATDPIASPDQPFQGDFIINGLLSSSKGISILSANIPGDIYCENIHVNNTTYTDYISGRNTETIISDGTLTGFGNNTLTLDYGKAIYARVNNTNAMYINSSGDVGIGTISATDVNGYNSLTINSSTSGGRIDFQKNNTQFGLIYSAGTNLFDVEATGASTAMRFNTNLQERMRITSAGNVGIGTTTPYSQLAVSGGIDAYRFSRNLYWDGTNWKYVSNGFATQINQGVNGPTNGIIAFETAANNTGGQGAIATVVERMRITSDGNVGIGVIPTDSKMQMMIRSADTYPGEKGSGSSPLILDNNSPNHPGMILGASLIQSAYNMLTQRGDQAIIFRGDVNTMDSVSANLVIGPWSASNRGMRITSSGNVGIGTANPNADLTVVGDISATNVLYSKELLLTKAVSGGNAVFQATSPISNSYIVDDSNILGPTLKMTGLSGAYIDLMYKSNTTPSLRIGTFNNYSTNPKQHPFIYSGTGLNLNLGSNDIPTVMTITSAGNVGIGTDNPRSRLDLNFGVIAGVANIRGQSNSGAYSIYGGLGTENTVDGGYIQLYGSTHATVPNLVAIGNSSAGNSLVVSSSGNVGIGTTTPTGTLHVSCSTTAPAVKISQFGSTGHALYVEDESGDGTPTVIDYAGHMGIGTNTPNKELTVVGDISATGTLYTHSSSYSLSSNGYTKLPNGLIMQWGRINTGIGSVSANVDVTFPITFKTACYNFVASIGVSASDYDSNINYRTNKQSVSYGIPTLSGVKGEAFIDNNTGDDRMVQWQAMGI